MQLFVKRLTKTAQLPNKAHPSDAGFDVFADADVDIRPGETIKIPTGIAIQLPEDFHTKFETVASLVWDRGSLGSKGISHTAGTIDFAFNGAIFICLTNLNVYPILEHLALNEVGGGFDKTFFDVIDNNTYHIKRGDKIAQILIQKILKVDVVEVDELRETDRGAKCLGSSGK